jgi:hypothetical protein
VHLPNLGRLCLIFVYDLCDLVFNYSNLGFGEIFELVIGAIGELMMCFQL